MKLRRSDIARVTRWSGSIFKKGFITPSSRDATRGASTGVMCVGTRLAAAAIAVRCSDFGEVPMCQVYSIITNQAASHPEKKPAGVTPSASSLRLPARSPGAIAVTRSVHRLTEKGSSPPRMASRHRGANAGGGARWPDDVRPDWRTASVEPRPRSRGQSRPQRSPLGKTEAEQGSMIPRTLMAIK